MGIYRAFSLSTEGASHKIHNIPCQDAALDNDAGGTDGEGDAGISIIVVADGHGSPQYFRSDIGSRFAAEIAMNGITELHRQCPCVPEALADRDGREGWSILDRLARHIISSWYTRVSDDELASPIANDDRLIDIDSIYRYQYLDDPDRQFFTHAYGSTLIVAAMTDEYWFGMQIGDGKCVVLYDDGTWDQPIPWDDECFLNITTSICDDGAIDEFRYWFGRRDKNGAISEYRFGIDGQNKDMMNINAHKPVAIFIATDGVDDSFPIYENDKHLVNLYRNIMLKYADIGYDITKEQINDLAKKMAEQGSRDDVSIAGIICEQDNISSLIHLD